MNAIGTAALMELVAANDGLSVARACKRLAMPRSELLRLLSELAELQLLRVDNESGRQRIWLTDAARAAGR